jgi:hypothetical protein
MYFVRRDSKNLWGESLSILLFFTKFSLLSRFFCCHGGDNNYFATPKTEKDFFREIPPGENSSSAINSPMDTYPCLNPSLAEKSSMESPPSLKQARPREIPQKK